MSEIQSDDFVFLARYPLFTIVNKAAFYKHGLSLSIIKTNATDVGFFLPIFTDEDLAGRFIDATIEKSLRCRHMLVALKTPNALRAIANHLKTLGCNHVGLDVSFIGQRITGRFYPTDEFLEDL